MVRVIPAILAKTREEFLSKVDAVRNFASELQLDVMDGHFVPNTTWADIEEIKKMNLPLFEAHLMAENPGELIEAWAEAGAKRIIFHFEAAADAGAVIKKIKSLGAEAGAAINPETPVTDIADFLGALDAVLVMGVNPGFSGQEFNPVATEKVAALRKINQNILIEVDGGVTMENAAELGAAGATGLVAANAIFSASDPKTAYEKLLKIANQ